MTVLLVVVLIVMIARVVMMTERAVRREVGLAVTTGRDILMRIAQVAKTIAQQHNVVLMR
jgi:hypothetical protein